MSNVREFDAGTSPITSLEPPIPPEFIETPELARPGGYLISDEQFMSDVETLKDLRSFMIQQAVSLKPSEAGRISLGILNLLRYDPKGRFPSLTEWKLLETHNQQLYEHLTDPLRRKFLYGRIPNWVIPTAGILGIVAVLSIFLPLLRPTGRETILASFLIWAPALGGVGSIAFIGMNALAVQEDATFDITNNKLIALRVALGALFGAVLTLPVGFPSFLEFLHKLAEGNLAELKEIPTSALLSQTALLLLPFILGFSTSLVIMILNQFVEAVQSFFGKKSNPPPPAAPPTAAQPPNLPSGSSGA
jgi:hypothetical protein